MICVLFLVVTVARVCRCDADNSSAVRRSGDGDAVAARRSGDLAATLRRQLMRDNYDYQNTHTDDDTHTRTQHKQRAAADSQQQQVLRTNDKDLPDEPDEPNEPEEPDEQQENEEQEQQDEVEERHEPNYPPESQYANERRDHEYDVPDGVDPADTHDIRDMRDAYDERDAIEPDRRGNTAERHEYEPAQYRSRGAAHPLDQMQVAPVSHAHDTRPARHLAPAADYSEPAYDTLDAHELRRPHVTRTNKLRPYDPRVHDRDTTPPPPHPHAPHEPHEPHQPHSPHQPHEPHEPHQPHSPRGHNISKKDLYYYVDDDRLRRNNDVSADLSLTDAENVNQAMDTYPAAGRRGSNAGAARAKHSGKLHRHGRSSASDLGVRQPPRSQLVTVSASNVTYKLLTMKSREGRRSGARRFLEERAAQSVALISLDHAPIPSLRLPRARRQYMRDNMRDDAPLRDIKRTQHRLQ